MKFELEINKETSNYLERLTYETNSFKDIIDHIVTSHKNDSDSSVIESPVWKGYEKKYLDSNAEYSLAKDKLTEELTPVVIEKSGLKNPNFSWKIVDFNRRVVEITVNGEL